MAKLVFKSVAKGKKKDSNMAMCTTMHHRTVQEHTYIDKLTYLRMHWTCESCDYSSESDSSVDSYCSDSDCSDTMSHSMESLIDLEIPVRVGGCEKWVTGLTKRSTCDDIIYALLAYDSNSNDVMNLSSYVMYERWREVERPLKGRTKILKVWRAWGAECRNVRFFVKKVDNVYESSSEIVRTKRTSKRHMAYAGYYEQTTHYHRQREPSSRRHNRHRHTHDRERPSRHRPIDTDYERSTKHRHIDTDYERSTKHRHIDTDYERSTKHRHIDTDYDRLTKHRPIDTDFDRSTKHRPIDTDYADRKRRRHAMKARKYLPENIDPITGYPYDQDIIPSCAKYPSPEDEPLRLEAPPKDNTKNRFFHKLVKMILEQEKKIQDQATRLKGIDGEIDKYETEQHMARVERNGKNYVQNAYLHDDNEDIGSSASAEELRAVVQDVVKCAVTPDDAEEYVSLCESILKIQDRIEAEESRIEDLTMQIFSETQGDGDNYSLASGYDGPPSPSRHVLAREDGKQSKNTDSASQDKIQEEINKIRREIERSITLSAAQQEQLRLVDETLNACSVQIKRKQTYADRLAAKLGASLDHIPAATHELPPKPPLAKLRSKSCEMLSNDKSASELNIIPEVPTEDYLYEQKEDRSHRNSDSGVESLDNRHDLSEISEFTNNTHSTNSSSNVDSSLNADNTHVYNLNETEDDLDLLPAYVRKVKSKRMVPYFTYTTLDESKDVTKLEDKSQLVNSKTSNPDDSNSDTGLSSLHSDEPAPILETLV